MSPTPSWLRVRLQMKGTSISYTLVQQGELFWPPRCMDLQKLGRRALSASGSCKVVCFPVYMRQTPTTMMPKEHHRESEFQVLSNKQYLGSSSHLDTGTATQKCELSAGPQEIYQSGRGAGRRKRIYCYLQHKIQSSQDPSEGQSTRGLQRGRTEFLLLKRRVM